MITCEICRNVLHRDGSFVWFLDLTDQIIKSFGAYCSRRCADQAEARSPAAWVRLEGPHSTFTGIEARQRLDDLIREHRWSNEALAKCAKLLLLAARLPGTDAPARRGLERAIVRAYIDGRSPPFRVPCAIQDDLFRWRTADDKKAAFAIVAAAVETALGPAVALADLESWERAQKGARKRKATK